MARRKVNGGEDGQPRRRGRPRKAEAAPPPEAEPDIYDSDAYARFLETIDRNTSDLNTIQADRRELLKAEHQRGLSARADKFVRSLRADIRNDRITLRDAQEIIDSVNTLWDWTGLPLALADEQRGHQEELEVDPATI